jgi:hypothetical protein
MTHLLQSLDICEVFLTSSPDKKNKGTLKMEPRKIVLSRFAFPLQLLYRGEFHISRQRHGYNQLPMLRHHILPSVRQKTA